MKGIAFLSGLISGLLTSGIVLPAVAQVTSDKTTNTTVNKNGNNFDILNGIQKGNNLFHSFGEFSIPKGGEATFNNPTSVMNIINRVTGGSISNIDGLIKANGNANLFLINPAGIVFGENASLDIGGSFFGTTAQSILFKDGFEFSALDKTEKPLLTVSVPVGLQMGKNPGAIEVNGSGHNLIDSGGFGFAPFMQSNHPALQVKPGNTLALVGSNLTFNDGVLGADRGRLEVGSVANGVVSLDTTTSMQLGYTDVNEFGDVRLRGRSLFDVSGENAGSIQVRGREVSLRDGSMILSQNQGMQAGGEIKINASKRLDVSGTTLDTRTRSGINSETIGFGDGSKIAIAAPEVLVQAGGVIFTKTFNRALGGDIQITAANSLQVEGFSPLNPLITSGMGSLTFGAANSGNVAVNAGNIQLSDGGAIVTTAVNTGASGQLKINADTITINGANQAGVPSALSSSSFGNGNSGELTINTGTLKLLNGGSAIATAFAKGNAGNVSVNAIESVEVSGFVNNTAGENVARSTINSSTVVADLFLRQLFNLTDLPDGASGIVRVNAPKISITNGGDISARNLGRGQGGKLFVNAGEIHISQNSQLSTETASGAGGNITLNANLLTLRQQGIINTKAGGTGDGGNININAPIILGLENSDIIANAVEGMGGNINITTQGIFGLKFRDELTEESDITASSKFGVNGTVDINNFGIDPSSGLVELSVDLADSSQQIASGCSSNINNSFVATGRGGIPQNPEAQVDINPTWSDIRDLSAYRKRNNNIQATKISNKPAIVEATGFIENADGEIELVAVENKPFMTKQASSCS